jgi:hypothetical protein
MRDKLELGEQGAEPVDQFGDIEADVQKIIVHETSVAEAEPIHEIGLHVHIRFRGPHAQRIDVCAISDDVWLLSRQPDFDWEVFTQRKRFNPDRAQDGGVDHAMLIGVGEGTQSQERMALERPGRSRGRIWLFGVNECPVLLNDPRKSSITEAGDFVGLGHSILTVVPGYGEEGSLGLGSGLPTVEDRHLVDEMIE